MCAVMNSDRGLAVAGYVWFHSELQFLFRLTDLFFFFFRNLPQISARYVATTGGMMMDLMLGMSGELGCKLGREQEL